jgi:hypothetical protein
MTSSVAVPEPGALSIGTDGSMQGRTGSYDKRLKDMRNVYRVTLFCYAADAGQNYGLIAEWRLDHSCEPRSHRYRMEAY